MSECVCNFISEGSFSWELFTLSPKAIWQFQVWQGLNWLVFNNNFSVYTKLFSPFNPVSVTCELFTSSHWVLACSRDDQQSTHPLSLFSSNNIHKNSAFKMTLRIVIILSRKLYQFSPSDLSFMLLLSLLTVMYCLPPVDRAQGEALTMCVSFNFHSKSIKWESSQNIRPWHREVLSCSKQLPSAEVKVLTTVHEVSEVRALSFYHTFSGLCSLPSEVLTLQRT